MRLRISHKTRHAFATPAKSVIQILRLAPRSHDGHHVAHWRVDVDLDCQVRVGEDAFGNIVHRFSAHGPIEAFTVSAGGEVETFDTAGVVSGAAERFPPDFYLRDTDLTHAGAGVRDFAGDATGALSDRIERLHALMGAVHASLKLEAAGAEALPAEKALARKSGAARDFAHLFIAAARSLAIPSRYASGYFHGGGDGDEAGHAWAEAHVERLGWVGFDCVHDLCPQEAHVRVAVALDSLGAAPVRGAQHGGEGETLREEISIEPERPAQSQGQQSQGQDQG